MKIIKNLFVVFPFLVVLFLFINVTLLTAGCPSGSTCAGSIVWNQPSSAGSHNIDSNNDNVIDYCCITKTYNHKTEV